LRSDDASVEYGHLLELYIVIQELGCTELLNVRLYLLILIEDAFAELIMRISSGFSLVLGSVAYGG